MTQMGLDSIRDARDSNPTMVCLVACSRVWEIFGGNMPDVFKFFGQHTKPESKQGGVTGEWCKSRARVACDLMLPAVSVACDFSAARCIDRQRDFRIGAY
jgi:hypothetical protein